MNQKPTIAAFIIFITALAIAFYISSTPSLSPKIPTNPDTEIFIYKPEVKNSEVSRNEFQTSLLEPFIETKSEIEKSIKSSHKFCLLLIDAHEIEISDFWREVLNQFEVFEYYKAFPEALLRRLIYNPTFWGKQDYMYEDIANKPVEYPDYDYRSFKYRTSLVPDTIDNLKGIVNYFFSKLIFY